MELAWKLQKSLAIDINTVLGLGNNEAMGHRSAYIYDPMHLENSEKK